MPGHEFASQVRAVDWPRLRSIYGSGEIVRDIVLGLASSDEADVRRAWDQIGETVLQHQGTVYAATAAAAPFLCQIALDKASLERAAVIGMLAFLAAGGDEPFSPAGTAQAVRDAIRAYLGPLLFLWGTAGPEMDMAVAAVSVAFLVKSTYVVYTRCTSVPGCPGAPAALGTSSTPASTTLRRGRRAVGGCLPDRRRHHCADPDGSPI